MKNQVFKCNSECVSSVVDGKRTIVKLSNLAGDSEDVFEFEGLVNQAWELLVEKSIPFEQVLEDLARDTGVSIQEVEIELKKFVQFLIEKKLIE